MMKVNIHIHGSEVSIHITTAEAPAPAGKEESAADEGVGFEASSSDDLDMEFPEVESADDIDFPEINPSGRK